MSRGIFLLLGSNEGSPQKNLATAAQRIEKVAGCIIKTSSVYKTAPWGEPDQADFFNQVIEIDTMLEPEQLLTEILAIEDAMGRKRIKKWGSRIIDIDILFYRDMIIDTGRLKVPHPGTQDRKFTILPLSEIAPEFVHPRLGKTVNALLASCADPLAVEVVSLTGEDFTHS